mmetsp:Transcript_725/g.1328  ORF Transcript_725/g.1328 Transcript_725/m.1328 type:complete len:97 (-) Transcript_725:440-730(-)
MLHYQQELAVLQVAGAFEASEKQLPAVRFGWMDGTQGEQSVSKKKNFVVACWLIDRLIDSVTYTNYSYLRQQRMVRRHSQIVVFYRNSKREKCKLL